MHYPPIPPKKSCECNDPCISTDIVYYNGPNLPGTGIQNGTELTIALELMDNEILLLKEVLFNFTTTTTTTFI